MKIRNLVIAAVVLAVLACGVWWANKHPSNATSTTPASPQLANIAENQITQIDLEKKGGDTVTIGREKGKWVLTAPHALPADQDTVSNLASSLSPVSADSIVDAAPKTVGQYGLKEPSLTVTVHEKNGKTAKILFGDSVPAGSLVYAQISGKPDVYAVASSERDSFDKTENDLRDKRLLPFDSDKLTRVELSSAKGQMEFGKNNQNDWEILKPGPYRADNSQVQELVTDLSSAKMDLSDGFDPKKASADFYNGKRAGTVKVTDSSGTQTLELRKDGEDYYAKSSAVPGIYKLSGQLGSEMDKPVDYFRNKKIFGFGFNDPNKIEVRQGSKSQTYVRSGTDWKRDGKTLDAASVQALIDDLRDLTSTKFLTSGFTSPALSITVTSNNGKRIETADFSKSKDGYIAKRENEPNTQYALDASSVNDILTANNAIKPATSSKKK